MPGLRRRRRGRPRGMPGSVGRSQRTSLWRSDLCRVSRSGLRRLLHATSGALLPFCQVLSYAAHLTRLCCGLERGGDPGIYAAIQRWLNGAVAIEKPEAPGDRGRMTVADLRAARNVEEHSRLARDWAARVWEAYTAQHAVARNWIRAALSANPSGGELGRRRVHRKPR